MTETKVVKFKGDRRLRRGIARLAAQGWSVQAQSSRKARFSLLAGIFTRKQIHTVTLVRERT